MAGYIVMGTLAAFGLVSALWALYGLLLPPGRDGVLYAPAKPGAAEQSFARRYLWLRGLGLLRCSLIMVDLGLSGPERDWLTDRGITICSPSELSDRLKTGAETN
ncbi:MAG: hypothetical protein PUD80_01520 [Firmicutes bacterium]|nr:hypothetical protein [Bacillota bacterium]